MVGMPGFNKNSFRKPVVIPYGLVNIFARVARSFLRLFLEYLAVLLWQRVTEVDSFVSI